MLVCNVSLKAPRAAIAAGVVEAAAAADALMTGNVVFAALVDDPASVGETVDAYLGEIMVEAASAADVVAWVSSYDVAIVEAATANAAQDAALAVALATFDGTPLDVTLSNGNLTATHSNNSSNAGARSASLKSLGKYYFEVTIGQTAGGSSGDAAGILLSTGTFLNMLGGSNCTSVVFVSGFVWSNGGYSGKSIGGPIGNGTVVSVAIDLDNRKAWFRKNGGNWNGAAIGSENPATNTGGVTIASGSFSPAVCFNWVTGDNQTANFGQTAFTYAAPSGFVNWS